MSQGTLCYQAGTPVELASEVHFSDGNKLGYFRIGGRPPMLLCDFKAFQPVSMNDLLLQAEAAGQLGPEELRHLEIMRKQGLMPPPLAVDAPTPLVDGMALPGDGRRTDTNTTHPLTAFELPAMPDTPPPDLG